MKYKLNEKLNIPAYMQLYTQLREDITAGLYPLGGRLPSKRVLAAETGVSVITVEHALGILCDEGYTESRERSGCFVIYRRADLLPVGEARPEPRKSAAPRETDDALPFSVLARTMRRVLADTGEGLLVKSPNNGCPELRRAIAAYLARSRGMDVRPGQIVIGSGAEYLYGLIVQLLGADRLFALESPSYEKIRRVYEAGGAATDMLRLGPDGILTRELERTAAGVLHVTPYNSFPSRVTASASKRREYILWAQRRGGVIVEDDYDSEFTVSTKVEDTLFSLEPRSRVIYMNTFSRTIAPSMRAGYMVLPDALMEDYGQRLGFYSCTVPVFEQYVLARLLDSGDFERHINRIRRKRRRLMNEAARAGG